MFGKRLRLLRKSQKITQAELAQMLGYSKSSIGMWENGERIPDYKIVLKLSEIFNVDVNYLSGYESKNDPTAEPELSDGEQMMLDLFRNASPYQQEMILRMLEAAVSPKE